MGVIRAGDPLVDDVAPLVSLVLGVVLVEFADLRLAVEEDGVLGAPLVVAALEANLGARRASFLQLLKNFVSGHQSVLLLIIRGFSDAPGGARLSAGGGREASFARGPLQAWRPLGHLQDAL